MEGATLKGIEEALGVPILVAKGRAHLSAAALERLSPFAKKVAKEHLDSLNRHEVEFRAKARDMVPDVKAPDVASAIPKLREIEAEAAARRKAVREAAARKADAEKRAAAEEAARLRGLARDEERRAFAAKAADLSAKSKAYSSMTREERRKADALPSYRR